MSVSLKIDRPDSANSYGLYPISEKTPVIYTWQFIVSPKTIAQSYSALGVQLISYHNTIGPVTYILA
jgi:hypothetical protein